MNNLDKKVAEMYTGFFDNWVNNYSDNDLSETLVSNYHNYTYLVAKLIIKLAGNKQSDDVYFTLFVYLYRNGFLSKDKKFYFAKPEKEICGLSGVEVILGAGVCRNIAYFFNDIMYNIYLIKRRSAASGVVGVNADSLIYLRTIQKDEMPASFELKDGEHHSFSKVSQINDSVYRQDHMDVFSIRKENGDFYAAIYDPTNFIIGIIDLKWRNTESKDIVIDLRWNACNRDFYYNNSSEFVKFNEIANEFLEKIKYLNIKPQEKTEMNLLIQYTLGQIVSNYPKIEEFYMNNYSLLDSIYEEAKINNEIKKALKK